MSVAGYTAEIQMGAAPVAFTDAALSQTGPLDGTTWRLSSASMRVLSHLHAITAKVAAGGSTIAATAYTVDYLFGVVTFATAQTAPVLSGRYVPLFTVAECESAEHTCERAALETNFVGKKNTAAILSQSGATVTLEQMRLSSSFLDVAESDPATWASVYAAGTPVLVTVKLSAADAFRCWGRIYGLPTNVPASGLVSGTREFMSVSLRPVGRTEEISHGYGDPS